MRMVRVVVIPLLVCASGCGTLFNQQRSDTATAAQQKFTGIKFADLLKEERKHNSDLLAREISIAQRQLTATRDAKLIAIITAADFPKTLGDAIDQRMLELNENNPDVLKLLTRIRLNEESLRAAGDEYVILRTPKDPKFDCSGANPEVSARAASKWEFVQIRCGQLADLRGQLPALAKGQLGQTALKISATEQARADLAKSLKVAEKDADEMAKTIAAEQKKGKLAFDADSLKKLKERVAGVTIPSQDQLSSAGIDDVRIAAALRWTEIQKAAIDRILAAATSGATEPPPGVSDDLQIAAVLPSLAAQLNEGFRYPRVSALVMESQRLRIDADRYRRQLARVDEELALLREKLTRLTEETKVIGDAKGEFEQKRFDNALAKYTESWTASRIPLVATEWSLIGLAHDRALDQSEDALVQWEALVRTPLETLVAAAGSGLKPDEIAHLLHAIELGAIGVGVY